MPKKNKFGRSSRNTKLSSKKGKDGKFKGQGNSERNKKKLRATRKKNILLRELCAELKKAISWKLSERFRVLDGSEFEYECFQPRPATTEPYKSQGKFAVLWKGRDPKTGERRISYMSWEQVKDHM